MQFSKTWQKCGWAILGLTVVALVVDNAVLIFDASRLRSAVGDFRARNRELETEKVANEHLRRRVVEVFRKLNFQDRQLTRQLQECTSREDFAVKSGPRIAWCEFRGGASNAVRIGLYLPEGKHRFKYAACDVANLRVEEEVASLDGRTRSKRIKGSGLDRKVFQSGDVKKLPGSAGRELGIEPRIYEIVLTASEEEPLRMKIIFDVGIPPVDCELPLKFGSSEFRATMADNALAWPSEVKLVDGSFPLTGNSLATPVTELAAITVVETDTGREADIRLWIESDIRPSISALEVAANYKSLAPREFGNYSIVDGRELTAANTEFKGLFTPYDGSERLLFRAGIFTGSQE